MFLESRLNSTQDYNLVGRLGGREENHLATIAAAREGRVWNSHREGKKGKTARKKKKKRRIELQQAEERSTPKNYISHNTANVAVVVMPELYYLQAAESTKAPRRRNGQRQPILTAHLIFNTKF